LGRPWRLLQSLSRRGWRIRKWFEEGFLRCSAWVRRQWKRRAR
jgi:hypothetical protein